MRLPNVHGVIRRRLLVNFRADAAVVAAILPPPFRPKLQDGWAIVGICLIRLEEIRPKGFPRLAGLSSENAAHRIAVVWDEAGATREGVYIPRRDTGSLVNHLAGGRLFPGEHQRAAFEVVDTPERVSLDMRSADGAVHVRVVGRQAAALPPTSIFASLEAASGVLRAGLGRLLGDGVGPAPRSGRVDDARLERGAAGDRARRVELVRRSHAFSGWVDRLRLRADHAQRRPRVARRTEPRPLNARMDAGGPRPA